MGPQPETGWEQDPLGPESRSGRRAFRDEEYEDDQGAPTPRRSSNRRQGIAAILIVLTLVLLAIYGANIFEWVSAIVSPHQDPCNPVNVTLADIMGRSEERRVGKECRSRWS